jgi:hypothetical protein
LSQHRPAVGATTVKALAAELYGLTLDDARAAAIAGELGRFEAGAASSGPVAPDTAPGALFRQLLLANEIQGARRA